MPHKLELEVPEDATGERLDVFLARHVGSRTTAQKLLDGGAVLVDGVARPKRFKVSPGEAVAVDLGSTESAAAESAPAQFEIAFEDEYLLVVDKPAGVVVHPARAGHTGTLVQALTGRVAGGDDPERPGVVHRLDRDTSGLLVIARTEEMHAALKQLMMERAIAREYIALVMGHPSAVRGTIDARLGRDRHIRTRVSIDTDVGRDAITHFEVLEQYSRSTLLQVRLETGRTHQIRAHMKAIGLPVAGDREYGSPEAYGLHRQFLHAARLAFTHPMTKERVEFESELPVDLASAKEIAAAE